MTRAASAARASSETARVISRASVTGCVVWSARKSRLDTTPIRRPSSTSDHVTDAMARHLEHRLEGERRRREGDERRRHDGATGVAAGSRPSATTFRRKSRSVTMPTGAPSASTTTTEPTPSRERRRATSIAETSGAHVTGGRLTKSRTRWRKSDSSPGAGFRHRGAQAPPRGARPACGGRRPSTTATPDDVDQHDSTSAMRTTTMIGARQPIQRPPRPAIEYRARRAGISTAIGTAITTATRPAATRPKPPERAASVLVTGFDAHPQRVTSAKSTARQPRNAACDMQPEPGDDVERAEERARRAALAAASTSTDRYLGAGPSAAPARRAPRARARRRTPKAISRTRGSGSLGRRARRGRGASTGR